MLPKVVACRQTYVQTQRQKVKWKACHMNIMLNLIYIKADKDKTLYSKYAKVSHHQSIRNMISYNLR